jgi:uncharacterized membrane protein
MMKTLLRAGIAVALAFATLASVSPSAQAQEKHDSNTLHKLGKAIQYPVRKAAENASVTAHRATGSKSVVHRRNGNKTYRAVVTPKGNVHRIYRVGPHGRRARRHYNRTHKH